MELQTYTLTHKDGTRYSIKGPPGKTREEVKNAILKRIEANRTPEGDLLKVTQPPIEQDEDAQIKLDAIEALKMEDQTYDGLRQNQVVLDAAKRFANDRLGYENMEGTDAFDEVIEHFRSFDVNEMTAARDYGYVSGLKTDKKEGQLNDYRVLFNAYDAMPNLYEEGAAPGAFLDYLEGIATAPSTYIGLLLPGGGKVAGQAAVQANKLLISRLVNQMSGTATRRIATTAAVEGLGGVAQDVAAQKTLLEADIQKDYSALQTTASFVLSATPAAVVPLVIKEGAITYIEKGSKDIIEITQKAIKEKDKAGNKAVEKLIKTKKSKENFDAIANKLISADPTLAPLTEKLVVKGEKVITNITGEKNLYQGADINNGLGLKINEDKFKNIVGSLTEILQKSTPKGQPLFRELTDNTGKVIGQERITEALARTLRGLGDNDSVVADNFGDMLKKYNLTTDDIANVFMAEVSQAGRLLSTVGKEKQNLNKLIESMDTVAGYDLFGFSKEAVEGLKNANKLAKDANPRTYLYDGARALDQARLAFMTSQVGTTVRNTISGYSRVGFDVLTQTINNTIAGITKKGIKGNFKKQTDDVFAIAFGLANRQESKAVRLMLENGFGNEASRLFRELADIQDATGGKVSRLQGISRQVNALNTLSDNMFKEAALTGNLKRQLNVMYTNALRQGKEVKELDFDLIDIMKRGDFNKVFGTDTGKVALQKAIDDSLYFTYQRSFNNPTARAFTQAIHSVPFVGTSFIPFPRFMMNAMKFTYEYSPFNMAAYGELFGAVTGRGSKEYVQSYEQAAKGMVGMGMLIGATAMRMSEEHAGERWYEGKLEDGTTVDLRPMFPAAPYLFLGDIIARNLKGDPVLQNRKIIQDGIQALSGAQFKAGMGLYMLESGIEDLFSGDPEKINKMMANFGGNILSTFTIPATVLQDPYNTFIAKDDERIIRDTNSDSMFNLILNKTLSRLPANNAISEYLEDTLGKDIYKAPDPLKSANTGENIRRITPLTRQMYGVLQRGERTEFEKELERLKILPSTVYRRTRNPEIDAFYSSLIGRHIQAEIEPYLKSDSYKNIKNWEEILEKEGKDGAGLSKAEIQRILLKSEISRVKSEVMKLAREYSKQMKGTPVQRFEFEKLPDTQKSLAYNKYHNKIGSHASDDEYDYIKLLEYAKEAKLTKEVEGL